MKLQINNQLIKNLRHSFTNKTTVINELLQNAERSGSDKVCLFTDEKGTTLQVLDYGDGIEDMQNLLTLAESNWSDETTKRVKPWGFGFMSAIFASDEVIIESKGKRVVLDTEAVLNMESFHIGDIPKEGEWHEWVTRVTLKLSYTLDLGKVKKICRGFSLPVRFNNELVPNTYALREDNFVELPGVGKLLTDSSLNDMCKDFYLEETFYHSGFRVDKNLFSVSNTIIHVDPELWTARQPDRDQIIDFKDLRKATTKELKKYLIKELKKEKAKDIISFGEKYWKACKMLGCQDLFNDIPILPAGTFSKVEQFPELYYGCLDNYSGVVQELCLTQDEVKCGHVIQVDNIEKCTGTEQATLYQIGYILPNSILVNVGTFSAGHWVRDEETVTYEDIEVTVKGIHRSIPFTNTYMSEVSVHSKDVFEVVIKGKPYATDVFVDHEESVIHIGKGFSGYDQVLRLMDDYFEADTERFMENEIDADAQIFEAEVATWCATPEELLESKISDVSGYTALRGKSFLVTVNYKGELNAVLT